MVEKAITIDTAIKKKAKNQDENKAKKIKSNNFMGKTIEKSQILLSQYWKNYQFDTTTNILYFG